MQKNGIYLLAGPHAMTKYWRNSLKKIEALLIAVFILSPLSGKPISYYQLLM